MTDDRSTEMASVTGGTTPGPGSGPPLSPESVSGEARFDAFISYSRKDGEVASALKKALEHFRPPKGIEPRRRLRVFLDTGDMTGTEYGAAIERCLARSDKLLVLCSPDSRDSVWVNDEIRRFIDLKGADDVVPVMVRGIPNNEGEEGDPDHAFPPALTEALGMPLATNYVGFSEASGDKVNHGRFAQPWYMLLANLLDVTRHQIEERDRHRRARTLRRWAAAAVVLVAALSALSIWALISRANEKRARLEATAGLIEARAVNARLGQDPALTDPSAALLLAREALAIAQQAVPAKRMAGAESVIRGVMAGLAGMGLVSWQGPIPRQTNTSPWSAIDPTGRWLVTGNYASGHARVWDLSAEAPVLTATPLEQTNSAYFVGDWLITGGPGSVAARPIGAWDNAVQLSDAGELFPQTKYVPETDTSVVVTVGYETVLRLEDAGDSIVATPTELEPIGAGPFALASVSGDWRDVYRYSPDGRYVSLSPSGVLDRESGAAVVLEGSGGSVQFGGRWAFGAHTEGGYAAWALDDGTAALFRYWPDLPGEASVDEDARWIVTHPESEANEWAALREAWLHPLSTQLEITGAMPIGMLPPWGEVRFTPDGGWIVAEDERVFRLIDLPGAQEYAEYNYLDAPSALAWVPGTEVLYTAHQEGTVRRWTRGTGGAMHSEVLFEAGLELGSLAVSADETWVLGEPSAGGLQLWVRTDDGSYEDVSGFEVSPELYWDLDWTESRTNYRGYWKGLTVLEAEPPLVGSGRVAFDPPFEFRIDENVLVGWLASGGTIRWNLSDPTVPPVITDPDLPTMPPVYEACLAELVDLDGRAWFSPDGRWFVTGGGVWARQAGAAPTDSLAAGEFRCDALTADDPPGSLMTVVDTAAVSFPIEGGGSRPAGMGFSPDSRWLVVRYSYSGFGSCGYGADLRLVDLAAEDPGLTMAPLRVGEGTDCPHLLFSPSQRWIATNNYISDLTAPVPTRSAVELPGPVLTFHPDETYVVVEVRVAEEWRTIRMLPLGVDELLDEACLRAGRNLTTAEWRAAFPGEPYRALCPGVPVPAEVES